MRTYLHITIGVSALLWMCQPIAAQIESSADFKIQNEDDIDQLESDGRITEEAALVLREMLENPIDLNRADATDLVAIPRISRGDAQAILDQRQKQNGFVRWNDLLRIGQLGAQQRRTLRAFTEIRPRIDRFDGRLRIDTSETDKDGDPYYSRLRVRSSFAERFFFGFAAQHEDDTEYQWKDGRPDLISPGWRFEKLYLEWSPGGIWKQIIFGNFTAGFGSGLTFNDAHRSTPKGIYTDDTSSPFRQRGVAAAWGVGRWSGTVFVSDSDFPVTLPRAVTNLRSQQRVNRVYNERLIGSAAAFHLGKHTEIGGVGYRGWIDKRLDTEFRNLPNRARWSALGIYASTEIQRLDLRGEISHTLEAGWASYIKAEFRTRSVSLVGALRRYDTDFDNPHSHGAADSDDTTDGDVDGDIDEAGVFLQVRYRPHRRLHLRAYYDQWQHPSSLETDNEAYAEIEFRPADLLEVGISGKWNDEEISIEGDERRSGLLWLGFQPHPTLRLTPVYRRSRHRSLSRITLDDYIYLKVEWLLAEAIEWEMRWKINDTAFIDEDTFPKEFYVQLQFWNWQAISGRIRYTQSRFGSGSTAKPNPKNRIYARIEYEW
ncbi:MAG: helix-hairpin-helix domain-containing protein [Candidatus Poribacteria bacterium]|nr:helix-hairpin-helix domain-containing protein [Candidatus Poribacteria bacterium]